MQNRDSFLHELCRDPYVLLIQIEHALDSNHKEINWLDQSGHTPLFYAVENNREDIATLLMNYGADANLASDHTFPPLVIAAGNDDENIVRRMLTYPSVDINIYKKEKLTPLAIACQEGNEKIVDILITAGADQSICTLLNNQSPLFLALTNRHWTIARKLILANPELINREDCFTTANVSPLLYAASAGNTAIIKLLLISGADHTKGILNNDSEPQTILPLEIAAYNSHIDTVTLLLAKPHTSQELVRALNAALFHIKNQGHYLSTSLIIADMINSKLTFNNGAVNIAQLLVREKVDVNACRNDDFPLIVIAAAYNNKNILKILLAYPDINVNAYKKMKVTALYMAAQNGHEEVVDLLLAANADPSLCSSVNNQSPFMVSIINKNINIALKLIRASTDKHNLAQEVNQLKFMHKLCEMNADPYYIEKCIVRGADIDKLNSVGSPPIIIAANAGNLEGVKVLLRYNAKYQDLGPFDDRLRRPHTPLDLAVHQQHIEIVDLLLQYPHTPANLQVARNLSFSRALTSNDKAKRELYFSLVTKIEKGMVKFEPGALTMNDCKPLTWDEAYTKLFLKTPNKKDRKPEDAQSAIRNALTVIYQSLQNPKVLLPYIMFLSKELEYQWYSENGDYPFPVFNREMIDMWVHEGSTWPIPNQKYSRFKKNRLLSRVILDKFQQHEMGKTQHKWTGFIPRPISRKLLLDNVFFNECRELINGLFHGNMHNIQRCILLMAMEDGYIPLHYRSGNITQTLKPKQVFSALMDRRIFPGKKPGDLLWTIIMDTAHFDKISFSHPHMLNSVLLTSKACAGFLQDYLLYGFCEKFIRMRDIYNHVYGTKYSNSELCNDLSKINFHLFGGLPETAIAYDKTNSLDKVPTIDETKGSIKTYDLKERNDDHYKPLKQAVKLCNISMWSKPQNGNKSRINVVRINNKMKL